MPTTEAAEQLEALALAFEPLPPEGVLIPPDEFMALARAASAILSENKRMKEEVDRAITGLSQLAFIGREYKLRADAAEARLSEAVRVLGPFSKAAQLLALHQLDKMPLGIRLIRQNFDLGFKSPSLLAARDFLASLKAEDQGASQGSGDVVAAARDHSLAPLNAAPKGGQPFYVTVREVYRWLAYKPQARKQLGKAGRWQRHNGYGWENAELHGLGWAPIEPDGREAAVPRDVTTPDAPLGCPQAPAQPDTAMPSGPDTQQSDGGEG